VTIKPGARGQFDVLLDGELIASKTQAGIFARLIGRTGFPDETLTVDAIKQKLT